MSIVVILKRCMSMDGEPVARLPLDHPPHQGEGFEAAAKRRGTCKQECFVQVQVPLQSLRGEETALQDQHCCKAPPASGPAWCLERLDTGNSEHRP